MSLEDKEFEDSVPDLRTIWRIIRQRLVYGILVGLLLSGIWVLYQANRTPMYTSSIQMLVEIMNDKVVDIEQVVDEQEVISRSSRLDILLNQHLIAMKSQEFRQFVISSLSQVQINSILEPYQVSGEVNPSIQGVLGRAVVAKLDSRILSYKIESSHPVRGIATMLADVFADQYIRFMMSEVGSSNENAISFLQLRADGLEDEIRSDEDRLQAFRREHNIVSIESSQRLAFSQLERYKTEEASLTVEVQSQEAVMRQVEEADDELAGLLQIPQIAGFRNVSKYKQEIDLAGAVRQQMGIELLELHPRMIENESLMKEYQSLLDLEVSSAVDSMKVSLAKTRSQILENKKRIQIAQNEIQRLEQLAIEYDSIVRTIVGNKATLTRINQRLNDTQIAAQLSSTSMRIVDAATVPRIPSVPNIKITISVAFALFGFGFVCIPFGLHFLDDKIKAPADVEIYMNKPLLAEIGRFSKKQKERLSDLVADGEDPMLVDTFRSIFNELRLIEDRRTTGRVQVITSTIPNEGKTMFCMNYGAIVAQHGLRALVIDCDLRRPSIEGYMGFRSDKGLVRWMKENRTQNSINDNGLSVALGIQQVGENHFILPAGESTNMPTELIESVQFSELIQYLRKEYDNIIIDTPPVAVFPDALFLANYANDVVYICSYNNVSKRAAKTCIDRFSGSKSSVCGVVLNGRKASRATDGMGYGYKYTEKYYKDYYRKTGVS